MKKRTVGAALCVASGAAALVSWSITANLLRFAMDREVPRGMVWQKERRAKKGGVDAVERERTACSELLERRPSCEVTIVAEDGTRLVGHWYPCDQPRRVLIAMHGWRSSWSRDFGMIADFWHDAGCSILFAEQRGQNKSEGKYITFGLIERYDCRAWIDWVNTYQNPTRLPVYLAGISMGATTVLMSAGLTLPDNIHGVIADCGFTSPHDIWRWVVTKNMHLSYGLRGRIVNRICRHRIAIGSMEYSTLTAMRESQIPVLFVHGTDDKLVPISMTYENYKACRAPKRLLVVPGAGHGMSYHADREGYESAVCNFFGEFDESRA